MSKVVRIENLSYAYHSGARILDKVNLEISENEVFVLLGHNGAGKTTLIRLMLDFLRGYEGKIELFGQKPEIVESRKKVGFMSEQPVVYDYETASGYLKYFAELCEIDNVSERINELMELTGLIQHKNKKLIQYSKGMLQRLNLARALLNDPELLIMDEPVIGLDPLGQDLIEKVVKSRKQKGKSVFINTHAVGFAARLADRVGFLMGGVLKKTFERKDFEKGSFPFVYEIEDNNGSEIASWSNDFACEKLAENIYKIKVSNQHESDSLLELIVKNKARILHVAADQAVLEKAFVEYAGDLSLEDKSR